MSKGNKRWIAPLSQALLTIAMTCLLSTSAKASEVLATTSEDEKTLRSQAVDYAKAFSAGDAKAIANMWTPDGTFTDAQGREFKGRDAIEQLFASYFKRVGAQPLSVIVESIRFPESNIAIEEGSTVTPQGRTCGDANHYMVVHVKQNGIWQMFAVSETGCTNKRNDSLQDLSWLVGNWSANTPGNNSLALKADWVANHNFIRCMYQTNCSTGEKTEAVVIIGRDPIEGRIISWHFDTNGGYGSGKWLKNGDTWIEQAKCLEQDGTAGSATYILRKLDDNTFTWRSTDRSIGGRPLPDRQEIKVTRDQSQIH